MVGMAVRDIEHQRVSPRINHRPTALDSVAISTNSSPDLLARLLDLRNLFRLLLNGKESVDHADATKLAERNIQQALRMIYLYALLPMVTENDKRSHPFRIGRHEFLLSTIIKDVSVNDIAAAKQWAAEFAKTVAANRAIMKQRDADRGDNASDYCRN